MIWKYTQASDTVLNSEDEVTTIQSILLLKKATDVQELKRLAEITHSDLVKQLLFEKIVEWEPKVEKNQEKQSVQPCEVKPKICIKNYSFEQSDRFAKFYVPIPESFTQSDTVVSVDEEALSVSIQAKNSQYSLVISKLCDKVRSNELILRLEKANSNRWECASFADKKAPPKVPKMDKDSDPTGTGGLMKMLQNMYNEGDDETKRMLSKAWAESQKNKRGDIGA